MPVRKPVRYYVLALAVLVSAPLFLFGLARRSAPPMPSSSSGTFDDRVSVPTASLSSRGVSRSQAVDTPTASPTSVPTPTVASEVLIRRQAGEAPSSAPALPSPTPMPVLPIPTPDTRPPELQAGKPWVYTVQPGDNLSTLAARFDVSIDSIVWANESLEENRDSIRAGRTLLMPPVTGVLHAVISGDTISGIAARYKVPVDAITSYASNGLRSPYVLQIGQVIVVPGGVKPPAARYVETPPSVARSSVSADGSGAKLVSDLGSFIWPLQGLITQNFSASHLAVDIHNKQGTAIVAAADGLVTFVGDKTGGFGLAVAMDNGDGWTTLYSHMSAFNVEAGARVKAGDVIGFVGQTGIATGPHLDFRIYFAGGAVDPLRYLS